MAELLDREREVRRLLAVALRDELLGPSGGENEEIREGPALRYLVGRLAPAGTGIPPEEDEGHEAGASEDEDASAEGAVPISMSMNPSSIGLSFLVAADVQTLRVEATWGEYRREQREPKESGAEGSAETDDDQPADTDSGGARKRGRFAVNVREPGAATWDVRLSAGRHSTDVDDTGVALEAVIRRLPDGRWSVSVFLVNRKRWEGEGRPPDDLWIFQPKLRIVGLGNESAFEARRLSDAGELETDPDLAMQELLYWNHPEFAAGHGCAASWEPASAPRRAQAVWTEIVPAFEVPRVDPVEDSIAVLEMRALGGDGPDGVPADRLVEMVHPLADAYGEWINGLTGRLSGIPSDLRPAADERIDAARNAHQRITEGIELLRSDPIVRQAFCFANRAMALQRERTRIAIARRTGQAPPAPEISRWRPFQLAFIMLNLPSLSIPHHDDRGVADLLWFPTGGGKTEAYMGLTAFVLALHRLTPGAEGLSAIAGVTVLMRYTLRLLTIQQFQRASTLICACELLRQEEGIWGDRPFGIGLWVGRRATPNDFAEAREALERIAQGHRPKEGTPIQLVSCPWCGTELRHSDYHADDERERVFVTCANDDCDFASTRVRGLPVHVVDDDLYRSVPSLVIATVDKFARMPWNGRVQALFGRVDRHCPRHGYLTTADRHPATHPAHSGEPRAVVETAGRLMPPALVIQDELHLIAGPLGTLVGMYETAVDALATFTDGERPVRPKVIASTATIRRADEQVQRVFDRRLQVFPPPGIDAGDSHFGREIATAEAPGRLFIGVQAPGKSVKTALVRVYANLLSRAQALRSADAETADPHMTLVGYFNSLRELGGALRLVEDDVPGRIRVLNRRDSSTWASRILFERQELTSNRTAEEIPDILARLERIFPAGAPESGLYPIDVLLASNMISVGVDISRLGLMVVNGQPKTTAEYIQATSRVGRFPPGLIVTVYNWTRPRDLSHYERFRSYHRALYRFVEATGVTPFSSRSRDKALEGLLTALVRLGDAAMAPEQAAGTVGDSGAVSWAQEVIERRAANVVVARDAATTSAQTLQEALSAADRWTGAADDPLCYTKWGVGNSDRRYLLGSAEEAMSDGVFEAPGSLREVEPEIHVYIVRPEAN